MKIAIIGYSGAGKSTLAKKLSNHYGCEVIYLDKLQYLKNWVRRDKKESYDILDEYLKTHDSWIMDGNYIHNHFWERMEQADQIIFMNFNRFLCLYQAYKRYFTYRNKSRESITEGCKEHMNPSFVWWILRDGRTKGSKDRYQKVIDTYKDKVVVICNHKELEQFLKNNGIGNEEVSDV